MFDGVTLGAMGDFNLNIAREKVRFESPWEALRCLENDTARILANQFIKSDNLSEQLEGVTSLTYLDAVQNKPEAAIVSFRDAQFLCDGLPRKETLRVCLLHGIIQRELGAFSLAVESLERCYSEAISLRNPKETAMVMQCLALTFYRMCRFPEAMELWEAAEPIVADHCHPLEWAHLQAGKALIAIARQDWPTAINLYEGAHKTFVEFGAETFAIYALAGAASASMHLGNPAVAIPPLQKAAQRAEAMDHLRYASLFFQKLADAYALIGERERAIEMYEIAAARSMEAQLHTRARIAFHSAIALAEEIGEPIQTDAHHRAYVKAEKAMMDASIKQNEASLRLLRLVHEALTRREQSQKVDANA